ncbi:MAG: hypothetical protein JOY66_04215 [Acetobacteraceae bacterium]|nr:hypothetical protein [Acetobacteraceae bacterium]
MRSRLNGPEALVEHAEGGFTLAAAPVGRCEIVKVQRREETDLVPLQRLAHLPHDRDVGPRVGVPRRGDA